MAAEESALLRKLNRFLPLSAEEASALARIEAQRLSISAGAELVHEHEAGQHAFILQEGWAYCYKPLPDGDRQVIDVRVPGDFIGLRSVLLRTADHSATTLTDVVVSKVPAEQVFDTVRTVPRLGAAMLWAASLDELAATEHLLGIGRRSALARTAYFLVELGRRLELVGLGTETNFVCQLGQDALCGALELTAIHLNRILRILDERGLVTLRDGKVKIHDLSQLRQLAGHYHGYLDQAAGLPN